MEPFKPRRSKGISNWGNNSGSQPPINFIVQQAQKQAAQSDIEAKKQQLGGALPPGSSETISENPSLTVKTPDFSLDEARAISNAGAFGKHSSTIRQYMETLPREKFYDIYKKATIRMSGDSDKGNIMGFPTTFGDMDAQKINFAIRDMEDRLLRLRSGASINEQEFNRLTSLLPSYTDISDPSDVDFSVIKNKLSTFENELKEIKTRLTVGGQYDPNVWEDNQGPQQMINKQAQSQNDPFGLFS